MSQVIIITGASSGFGNLTTRLLSKAAAIHAFAAEHKVTLRTVILDVLDTNSVNAAVSQVFIECGSIDTIIHNAGHGCLGPVEAFTPDQLLQYVDVNVAGTQRLNHAALPHMRKAGRGTLVWVSSSSCRGGTPPFLGPYFAAKAAVDFMAVSYAGEVARWGIETSIIVPGAFTKGTNHFTSMGKPSDEIIAAEYMEGPYKGAMKEAVGGLAALEPEDSDPENVARAIVGVMNLPRGRKPFRVHVDPGQDGAEIVNGMTDRVRAEMLRRIGLGDTVL